MKYYILKDKIAVEVNSWLQWAEWMESADRTVAKTEIGGVLISTVFLGINHDFLNKGDPLLFETRVFLEDGEFGQLCRYFIWEEAESGHSKIVEIVRRELANAQMATVDFLSELIVNVRAGL